MGYVYYSYLIQLTSPIVWAGFINISNIMLVNLTILTLASIMLDNGIAKKCKNICNYLSVKSTSCILFTAQLKDALFLFYVCLIILCFEWLSHKRRSKAFILLLIVILTILVSGVRPWGFLVSVMFFALYYTRVSARLFRQYTLGSYVLICRRIGPSGCFHDALRVCRYTCLVGTNCL